MGTPTEELKSDGTFYLSGTEWEFEDAKRAGKPILLYRRTKTISLPNEDREESARQLRNVEQFLSQFKSASDALTGGVTTYGAVEELAARLKTDIETLLPTLRQRGETDFEESVSPDAGWTRRAQVRVRRSAKISKGGEHATLILHLSICHGIP
jgi:hypothetical protein